MTLRQPTPLRLLVLAVVAFTPCIVCPGQALAQVATPPPSNQPSKPNQQIQSCQKLATRVNRLKGSKKGPAAADQVYAAGITKLSRRYGYNPCPGLKAPNV